MPSSLSLSSCEIDILTNPVEESITHFLNNNSYNRCTVISDHTILSLFGNSITRTISQRIPTQTFTISQGEQAKTLVEAERCWTSMQGHQMDKHSLVVALGGGAITDFSGFVAGCYMRGIDTLYIPTTLMGMVDAAIGGKTAINFHNSKNLLGLFYPPRKVLISSEYLNTLPDREMRSGLAEVIKYGIICDPDLFIFLENQMESIINRNKTALDSIIHRCCQNKIRIVQQDEKDRGIRAILNYGHTLGHALESATLYSQFLHGEAVSIGMHFAARISQALGFVDSAFVERQTELCKRADLPTNLPENVSPKQLIELMHTDKKSNNGKISLILTKGLGNAFKVDGVDDKVILKTLQE